MFFDTKITRRELLRNAAVAAGAFSAAGAPLFAASRSRWFKIGACDWSLGKRNDPTSFDLAKQIGLDGVQIDMGTIDNDMFLRRPDVRRTFLDAAKLAGVEIASLGVAAFWQAPLRTDPRAAVWLADSVDVCTALGLKVVLAACFELDMNDKAGIDHVVKVFKKVAPKAEKQGVAIGLENWMSAEDHRRLLDRIDSPAVKVYYDVGNSTDKGRDVVKEIRMLGKSICELHFKDAAHMLGHGRIDFKQVRAALDDIEYSGWVQIEAAAPHGVIPAFTANRKYLKALFPNTI